MQHQTDSTGEPGAYRAVGMFQPDGKVDNRTYLASALSLWADVALSEPVPALDPQAVPEQAVPATLAGDYRDLLA